MPQSNSAKTFFGTRCADKLAERNVTAKEVAAKIPNTPASQFTRWKKGIWEWIPTEKLVGVAKAICPRDPRDQADLIIAYLTDITPVQYRPYILIGQRDENEGKGMKPMAGVGSGWSEEMRQRLDVVAEAYKLDNDFAEMVDFVHRRGTRIIAANNLKQQSDKK